ncbi:MAG: hypothetical protein WDN00_05625 [Limisphaerales bacterium]
MANALYSQVLLAIAVESFTGQIAPITAMSRATSHDALTFQDVVKVPYALPNSASKAFDYSTPYSSTTTLGVLPVTLNNLSYQSFTINDCDSDKLDGAAIATFAKQCGSKLAVDVVSASLASVITDANYPLSASITSNQLTSSAGISNLVTQADNSNWGVDNRNLILGAVGWNSLINNPSLNQAFSYGGSEVIKNGAPTNVLGFNTYKSVGFTFPNSCKGLVLNPNAVLFATGLHKPSNESNGLVQFFSETVDGITVSMKTWYDAANAKTVYVFECLSGAAVGVSGGLFQLK